MVRWCRPGALLGNFGITSLKIGRPVRNANAEQGLRHTTREMLRSQDQSQNWDIESANQTAVRG